MNKFRLALAAYLLLMTVLVDFVIKWLSVVSDAGFIAAALWALWPMLKAAWTTRS